MELFCFQFLIYNTFPVDSYNVTPGWDPCRYFIAMQREFQKCWKGHFYNWDMAKNEILSHERWTCRKSKIGSCGKRHESEDVLSIACGISGCNYNSQYLLSCLFCKWRRSLNKLEDNFRKIASQAIESRIELIDNAICVYKMEV